MSSRLRGSNAPSRCPGAVSPAAAALELVVRGWPTDALARIRAPIGLKIGAKSPGEIAVAILAEIIEAKALPRRPVLKEAT